MGNLRLVTLSFDRLALDFELCQSAGDLVEFLRHGVALHPQFGCCLVHQVDGLVRQEALGDIALRELYCCDTGIILYTNLVVVLVAFLQSSQDRDGRELIRLIHHHRLESALQGFVLLEVLLILVERCCTDGAQFSTCQGRFQDVGSVHRSLTTTGTYQCVNLVDKEDDAPFGLRHLVDDALQSLLELTLILRTSYQRAHIERIELLVLQVLWHIATDDTPCETFHDSGLTRTRLTDQDRVVLRAS